MIFKAKDLIKKEQVFQVEGDTYTNLKLACEKVACSAFLKRNIQMSTNLNRLVRLSNRLEREFLRGEELEKIDHVLKLSHLYFDAVKNGTKTAEIRFNDRGFKVGDVMSLNEIDSEGNLTNREPIRCLITHILEDNKYLQEGYVMLSFKLLEVSSE